MKRVTFIILFIIPALIFTCKKSNKSSNTFDVSLLYNYERYKGQDLGHWEITKYEIDSGDSTSQHFPLYYSNDINKTITFYNNFETPEYDDKSNKKSIPNRYKFGVNGRTWKTLLHFNTSHSIIIFEDALGSCPTYTKYKSGEPHCVFTLNSKNTTEWHIICLSEDELILSCQHEKHHKLFLKKIHPIPLSSYENEAKKSN